LQVVAAQPRLCDRIRGIVLGSGFGAIPTIHLSEDVFGGVGNDEDDLMEPPLRIELEILLGERISGAWKPVDVVEPKYSELWEFRRLEGSRGWLLWL
jgi:hypothetical protein